MKNSRLDRQRAGELFPLAVAPPALTLIANGLSVPIDVLALRWPAESGTELVHHPAEGQPVAWPQVVGRVGPSLRISNADTFPAVLEITAFRSDPSIDRAAEKELRHECALKANDTVGACVMSDLGASTIEILVPSATFDAGEERYYFVVSAFFTGLAPNAASMAAFVSWGFRQVPAS